MKTSPLKVFARTLGLSLLPVVGFGAQPVATAPRVAAALGLLRLQDTLKPGDAAKLATAKFAVDALPTNGVAGVSKALKDNLDTLVLDAGKEWSRPLRGAGREVTFASFQVYGSQTTIIEIGGARLGLTAGPIPGCLQLMFDNSTAGTLAWKPLNVHVSTGKYGGKSLVALPTLTVAPDSAAGIWHLYSGSRLLADHLPLITAKRDNRQFTVKAGTEGAWVGGLVLADENPLYEDANLNGIDDAFERQKLGVLLPVGAAISTRQQLAQDWKAAQRAKAPPALFVQRPMPDRVAPPIPGK
jgi:hypothetical protein